MLQRSFLVALIAAASVALFFVLRDEPTKAAEPVALPSSTAQEEVPLDSFHILESRSAVGVAADRLTRQPVALLDLQLADFQACYEARDEACCRDFIMDWFQFPGAGVDRLLGLMPGLTNRADSMTLALLLQSAMVLMEEDPGAFAPWDAGALIATTVGLADENEFMSRVLLEGLSPFGKAAHAEDFDTILALYGGGARQHGLATQLDQIRLLGAWIQAIPAEELGRFQATYAGRDITEGSYHMLGARLLVERDVQSGLDFLTQATDEMCDEYADGDPFVLQARKSLNIGLSVAFGPENPQGRVGLVEGLAPHPELLSYYIGTMQPKQLGDILAVADAAGFDPTTRSLFEVYTGGPRQEAAALELMQSAEFASFDSTVMADLQARNFKAGLTSAYNESMQIGFQARSANEVAYWSRVRDLAGRLDNQQQVEEAIVPWLEASKGETSAYRRGVVDDLRARFSALDWIE